MLSSQIALFSGVGFENGCVRILDALTLIDENPEPFRYSRDAVTHVTFSHDSKWMATAVSYNIILDDNIFDMSFIILFGLCFIHFYASYSLSNFVRTGKNNSLAFNCGYQFIKGTYT